MKMIKSIFITAAAVFLIGSIVSVNAIENNGSFLLQQQVDYKDFTKIDVSDAWDVDVNYGVRYKIIVSSTLDMKKYIDIDKSGNVLYLKTKIRPWAWFRKTTNDDIIHVKITMPSLEKIEVSGESNTYFSGFNADIFNIDASGSSKVSCENNKIANLFIESSGNSTIVCNNNKIESLSIEASGSSDLNFKTSMVSNANVYLSGDAKTSLKMRGGSLTGRLDGKASLTYAGAIKIQDISASGSSTIVKK